MAAFGLTPQDLGLHDDIDVWPENNQAKDVFLAVSTQWRTGMSGAVGLDYTPLFTLMGRMRLSKPDWWALFEDIRVLEAAALDAMAESND